MEDVLQSIYYKSPLGYDIVDWFVNEVIKLENRMTFCFENTIEDIVMKKKDEEDFKKIKVYRFVKKILNLIKLEIIVI